MDKSSTDYSDWGVTEIKVSDVDLVDIFKSSSLKPRPQLTRYIRTIPLPWATKVMALPGKSAALAMIIWYLVGISKNKTVTISPTVVKRFGICRFAARRALVWLEEAHLIRVARNGRHSPRVTVINENM